MATKTTGVEIKRFYEDAEFWPDDNGGTYHDDEEVFVDGVRMKVEMAIPDIADAALVTIIGGVVFGPHLEGKEPSFETYFNRWKKKQSTSTIVVECDCDKLAAVMAAIKAAGGRVV